MARNPSILSIRRATPGELADGHFPIAVNIAQNGLASTPVDRDYIDIAEALRLASALVSAVAMYMEGENR